MATGLTAYTANKVLDHMRGGTAWTQPAALYVKLHIGDPGAAGTGNPAAETTRKATTFGTASSGGAISNTAQVQWTNVAANETYSYGSLWDASTGGNCLYTGTFAAPVAVSAAGTFTAAIGDVDVTITIAS